MSRADAVRKELVERIPLDEVPAELNGFQKNSRTGIFCFQSSAYTAFNLFARSDTHDGQRSSLKPISPNLFRNFIEAVSVSDILSECANRKSK
jgi:hypothetical protein